MSRLAVYIGTLFVKAGCILEFRQRRVSTMKRSSSGVALIYFVYIFCVKVTLRSRSVVSDGVRACYVYFNRRFFVCQEIVHWFSLSHLPVTCTTRVIGIFYQLNSEEVNVS